MIDSMLNRITAGIDSWEQIPWTPRGKVFKTIVEFVVLTAFVCVGSIDIK